MKTIQIEIDETERISDHSYGDYGSGMSMGAWLENARAEGKNAYDLFMMGFFAWLDRANRVGLYAPNLYGDEFPVLRSQPLLDAGYTHEQIYEAGVDALLARRGCAK